MEERFDNLLTKSRVLDELSRKQEASATRDKAMAIASPLQLHIYGRTLQSQGKQDEAFSVFRANIKKNPDHWTAHNEAARLASAQGKFQDAAKEMRASLAGSPDQIKPQVEGLIKKLEAGQDINK
jgi:tetratricopeptide (TPR) repeat protein